MTQDVESPRSPEAVDAGNEPERASSRRIAAFVGVCVLAVVISVVAIVTARNDQDLAASVDPDQGAGNEPLTALAGAAPTLLFESTELGDTYGYLATVPLEDPGQVRRVSDLECERVHFRSGRGVCLQADRGLVTSYDALVFDADLEVLHTVELAGSPSRVRVSPDGSIAGSTVFVTGHSYADAGFSTQTTLLALDTGEVIADLETDFSVYRDGERWREVDFNFWGVTFIDDGRFYATLGTGGEHYLIEGDVDDRRFDVITDGVECPSLSPDGTRLAYKERLQDGLGPVNWRIMVLDLDSLDRTVLAEDRSVDDQVAWLDEDTVMFGLPSDDSPAETDTWLLPADGTGSPEMLIAGAWSTTVLPAG